MSGWTDIRDSVEKILPYAVTAFTGPAGPVLGGLLSTALGTKNDPDSVKAALAADPNAAEKILGYEVQIKTVIANQAVADHQADVAQQQSDAQDRDSARRNFGILKFIPQLILTVMFTGGYFILMYYLLGHILDLPPAQMALLSGFMGVMTGQVAQQGNFWFGSSHGSQKKDDALAQAALS
jgi:hypothetical protein